MFCTECGKEISEGVVFCRFCGAEIKNTNNIDEGDKKKIKIHCLEHSVRKNNPSSAIKVVGVIIIVLGMLAGMSVVDTGLAPIICLSAFVSGILIFGFAEVIQLLDDIKQLMYSNLVNCTDDNTVE